MTIMKKLILIAVVAGLTALATQAQKVVPIKYGNMDQWVTRVIKESGVIGGQTKHVYEIGPTQTINGAKAYKNLGGSPWGSSNVYAKVMGVVKTSNAVYPDTHGSGKCAKLTTTLEHVKAIGIINMDVLVSGSIFLGQMMEPLSSTKNPYSKMEMGVPYTQRPKFLQFDYKLNAPTGDRTQSTGFSAKKTVRGRDYAEVFIILQRRWEDSKGNLHAARVGTGRIRLGASTTSWVNNYRVPVWYGNITNHKGYQWDDANAQPTHMLLMASSGCGTAYIGTIGMTLWVDNFALVF